jgi:hypothetical protein
MLPGEVDQGEILMSIMERTSPEAEDAQSSAGFSESLTAVQREAEQALTHEEIPQGSKEFVRQYFGSLGAEETREEVRAE